MISSDSSDMCSIVSDFQYFSSALEYTQSDSYISVKGCVGKQGREKYTKLTNDKGAALCKYACAELHLHEK